VNILVLCPHFEPDTAPTGVVITRLVHELGHRGHSVHVVTALPWYRQHRIEDGWEGRRIRREPTSFGSVTRVYPFPGKDRRSIARRALGFAGFCALAGWAGLGAGRRRGARIDVVLAMSPPLPLGLVGWAIGRVRRAPLVFNVQDVFPDAAVETGAITNRHIIRVARWLERVTYHRSRAVTVLSDDLADNVRAKVKPSAASHVHMIPNFVDTEAIRPGDRLTPYRTELGIGNETVVMYAGNVGFSQSLGLLVAAARELPEVTFVVNGGGSARESLEVEAAGLANVRFGSFQPAERLGEVLATGDLHLVPLKTGLGRVSVPSKTYSILASGRPILAAVDPSTEVPRILAASGAGVAVLPDRADLFVAALRELLADPDGLARRGAAGRTWVEGHVSPGAVAEQYEALFRGLGGAEAV
jgi:colanic acid biosynthesis glycosyl transferase WcaI